MKSGAIIKRVVVVGDETEITGDFIHAVLGLAVFIAAAERLTSGRGRSL
jgi:hypothetical protein